MNYLLIFSTSNDNMFIRLKLVMYKYYYGWNMIQMLLQLVPVIFIGLIAYMTFLLSKQLQHSSSCSFDELCCFLQSTPALDSFFIFVLQGILFVSAILCTLQQVSNHIILTLDILYILSLILLSLYHIFKDHQVSPVKL